MSRNQSFYDSHEWASLRNGALANSPVCDRCGRRDGLDVHHRTYHRFGGDELPKDLVVWCRECHRISHQMEESYWISILQRLENLTHRQKVLIPNNSAGMPHTPLFEQEQTLQQELQDILDRLGRDRLGIHNCGPCPFAVETGKLVKPYRCGRPGFGCFPAR